MRYCPKIIVSPSVSFADTAYAARLLCRFAASPHTVGSHPRRGSLIGAYSSWIAANTWAWASSTGGHRAGSVRGLGPRTASHRAEDTYNDYVAEVIRRSDVDSGIRPEYGEQLLTLSTCEYSSANGRYVVVARKVSS